MMKKTKPRNPSKSKRASEQAVHSALSILETMANSDKEVQVMVIWPLFTLTFEAAVEKHKLEGLYTLFTKAFNIEIAPSMSETILFAHDGDGLFLARKDMSILIELEAHGAEELQARYPGASKLIH
jgi:hypothetical protein